MGEKGACALLDTLLSEQAEDEAGENAYSAELPIHPFFIFLKIILLSAYL